MAKQVVVSFIVVAIVIVGVKVAYLEEKLIGFMITFLVIVTVEWIILIVS